MLLLRVFFDEFVPIEGYVNTNYSESRGFVGVYCLKVVYFNNGY